MRPHRAQHCTSAINVGGGKQPRGADQSERERDGADAVDHAVVRVPEGAVAEVLSGNQDDALPVGADIDAEASMRHGGSIGQRSLWVPPHRAPLGELTAVACLRAARRRPRPVRPAAAVLPVRGVGGLGLLARSRLERTAAVRAAGPVRDALWGPELEAAEAEDSHGPSFVFARSHHRGGAR